MHSQTAYIDPLIASKAHEYLLHMILSMHVAIMDIWTQPDENLQQNK